MKTAFINLLRYLCVAAAVAGLSLNTLAQDILIKPIRGGGLDTNAPMIHVDIFYDYAANQMHATLDTNYGTAKLLPLPAGYAFDSRSNYFVLNGKAHNFQYAWNPGGIFSPPAGAAVWIECLSASPGLECYDGPGNKTISPPRTYAPIFGTAGSSTRWQWYGQMAHNSYAVLNPSNNVMTAQYRVYFGDAVTGAPDAYTNYNDATITLTWRVDPVIVVKTSRGGGLDTNAPMVHVDLFYDYTANQMRATLDTNAATPRLLAMPAGYTFDSRSNYYVLNGKAYNYQYAWNPGGIFSPPAGAAVWIECLSASPGLECYDGPGNKMLMTPRTYAPIFGTAGSSNRWQWYGAMAHNSYAVLNPTNSVMTAEYRIYFGDATTGAPDAYASYGDARMTLTWLVDLPVPPLFQFGADDTTNAAPLCFINANQCATNSMAVVNLHYTNAGPCGLQFECGLPMMAVPATASNGGPCADHAAQGSCLELELVSLNGPPGASLGFWEPGQSQPRFSLPVGEAASTNRFVLSESQGAPGADPYGFIQGRRFAVSQPGLYSLGFRVVDTSTNGPGGGPIHAPSPVYQVYLQAGLTIASLARQGASTTALFGGEAARTFYLERSPMLGPSASWQTVAGPLTGTSRLQTLTAPADANPLGFFRLRTTLP
ncbi:MAG: hypothetical protein NT154_00090 [Verrucomicrobia bacterium]|nr:hypothetical protein [Verrucomicrobiota bacterium]